MSAHNWNNPKIDRMKSDMADLKGLLHNYTLKSDLVLSFLVQILKKVSIMSPQLQAIADAIGPMKNAADAAVALLDGIKAQLDALIAAGGAIDPADVAQLAADIGAAKEELAAAVVRDTPASTATPTP